jgi:hypothetical protein
MAMGSMLSTSLLSATSVLQKVATHVAGTADMPPSKQQSQLEMLKSQVGVGRLVSLMR